MIIRREFCQKCRNSFYLGSFPYVYMKNIIFLVALFLCLNLWSQPRERGDRSYRGGHYTGFHHRTPRAPIRPLHYSPPHNILGYYALTSLVRETLFYVESSECQYSYCTLSMIYPNLTITSSGLYLLLDGDIIVYESPTPIHIIQKRIGRVQNYRIGEVYRIR